MRQRYQEMHTQSICAAKEREQVRREIQAKTRVRRFFGRVASVIGILVVLAEEFTLGDVGPAGLAGISMGALGYVLASRLGTAAIVLSILGILLEELMS